MAWNERLAFAPPASVSPTSYRSRSAATSNTWLDRSSIPTAVPTAPRSVRPVLGAARTCHRCTRACRTRLPARPHGWRHSPYEELSGVPDRPASKQNSGWRDEQSSRTVNREFGPDSARDAPCLGPDWFDSCGAKTSFLRTGNDRVHLSNKFIIIGLSTSTIWSIAAGARSVLSRGRSKCLARSCCWKKALWCTV